MKEKSTIALVDDERNILTSLRMALEAEGYKVRTYNDGVSALEALTDDPADLGIFDIKMPRMDGMELLRRLRQKSDLPVIFLTSKDDEIDELFGLKMGADDFIRKPFSQRLLVERVKAVLRRCQPEKAAHQLRSGGLVVDLDAHTVTVDGARVALTYKEFELLRLFLSHPGMAFTRDQLFQEIWGMDYCGETRTVDMHIRTLRQKLGPYGRRIETVRNVGYRMEATT